MSRPSDDELMLKIASGDRRAMSVLFERHSSLVLGYAQRLLGRVEKAEDISQDVWVRVVKAAKSYQGQGQFLAWVKTLTRNACFNEMRQQKRWEPKEEIEALAESLTESDLRASLEEGLIVKNKIEVVKLAIDRLPDMQRVVLVTYLNEEGGYEEISRSLGITVSSVKSLLFRARRSLQEKLGGFSE